ncbi:MAG: type III pantothenate kinase [candidate division Zixibacteria bacterium]|nr:type III pantothenate kinase [candidate division Zixibacteria bacterium]
MLICIDIGNTNTVVGIFVKNILRNYYRVSSNHFLTVDECGILIRELIEGTKTEKIEGVVIASVVPALTSVYQEMSLKYLHSEPITVSSKLPLGIKILYDDPEQVGADRIANAVASFELYGGPVIVVDLGTATTFDVVSRRGDYLGGAISPGIETSSAHLFQKAALLSTVELKKPTKVIGTNTRDSLKSGIIFGAIGQIDEIVRRIEKELGEKPKVIATGGLAELISKDSNTIQKIDQTLTLQGLKIIYDRVKKSKKTK